MSSKSFELERRATDVGRRSGLAIVIRPSQLV